MQKEYKVTTSNLSSALHEVEIFEDKMKVFLDRFPNFKYNLEILQNKETKNWTTKVKIIKDE